MYVCRIFNQLESIYSYKKELIELSLDTSRQLRGSKQRGVKECRLIDIQNVDAGNMEECM